MQAYKYPSSISGGRPSTKPSYRLITNFI